MSENSSEFLTALLGGLLGEKKDAILPVFNLLKENSFDLKKTVQNLDIEKIAPIISGLSDMRSFGEKTKTDINARKTDPISGFADKSVISALNSYFGE